MIRRHKIIYSLIVLFILFTCLAITPVFHSVDLFVLRHSPTLNHSSTTYHLLNDYFDKLAGMDTNLPILITVAMVTALFKKTFRPVLLSLFAEVFFHATAILKFSSGRLNPRYENPKFFTHPKFTLNFKELENAMSYPSGHSTEMILIYGLIIYLLGKYWVKTIGFRHFLYFAWVLICLDTAMVSLALHYHWLSDLIGGAIWGVVGLAIIVAWDKAYPKDASNLTH